MRNKLLGTIAAVAAGAGASLAQPGPVSPPMPIGPVGGFPGAAGAPMPGGMPAGRGPAPGMLVNGLGSPIGTAAGGLPTAPVGSGLDQLGVGGPGMMMGGPMMGDPMMGGGAPGYPAGPHGQPSWAPQGDGLFGAPGGVNTRLAARSWFNLEYLLWFAKSQPSNGFPLLTTSAPAAGGIPGVVSTRVLAGTSDFGYNLFSGFRIDGGFYYDEVQRNGVYLGGFMTEQKANITAAASDATGQPLIARPFFNVDSGGVDVLLASFPTFAAGNANIYTSSELYGAEGGSWTNLYRSCPEDACLMNLNMLFGFRYLELHEVLRMDSSSTLLDGATAAFDGKIYTAPATIGVVDEYEVYNRFYGGQIGFNTEARLSNYFVNATAKLALGVMNQRVDVRGFSTLADPSTGTFSTVQGGLYANSSNIGRYRNDEFAVIPEVTVNLGYQWASWLTTTIGYNYLYVSRVARPGNLYNPAVSPALIPTSPSYGVGGFAPQMPPAIAQSSYWMQGVQFGLVMRY